MKLLLLASSGGEALRRTTYTIAAAAHEAHDVRAFAPEREAAPLRALGVPVETWRPAGPFGVLKSLGALRRTLERDAPDAIHAIGWSAAAIALGALPPHLAARTLVTITGPVRKDDVPKALVETRLSTLLARAGAIAVTYPALARGLVSAFGVDEARVAIVPVAAAPILPEAPVRPAGRPGPIVGFLGNLDVETGWEAAIDAVAAVRGSAPDAALWLSGGGPLHGLVRGHARARRVADAVTVFDLMPPSALLDGVDLVLVPATRDPVPYTVIDTLLAGVPLVAANVGGVGDVLGPYTTGWLTPDDAPGLAAGIAAAWAEIDAARAGAAEQRAAAIALHDPATVRERTFALYARCAALGADEVRTATLDAGPPVG